MYVDLTTFSIQDLLEIKGEVEKRIQELRDEETFVDIRGRVNKYGFACEPRFDRDIPGLNKTYLPYYITVFSEHHPDYNLPGLEKIYLPPYIDDDKAINVIQVEKYKGRQPDWVDQIKLNYQPRNDEFRVIGDWEYRKIGLSIQAKAEIKIPIYYRRLVHPPKEFRFISENGSIRDARIDNGVIIVHNKELFSVENHNLLILIDDE